VHTTALLRCAIAANCQAMHHAGHSLTWHGHLEAAQAQARLMLHRKKLARKVL
jgi:hypothetical protein